MVISLASEWWAQYGIPSCTHWNYNLLCWQGHKIRSGPLICSYLYKRNSRVGWIRVQQLTLRHRSWQIIQTKTLIPCLLFTQIKGRAWKVERCWMHTQLITLQKVFPGGPVNTARHIIPPLSYSALRSLQTFIKAPPATARNLADHGSIYATHAVDVRIKLNKLPLLGRKKHAEELLSWDPNSYTMYMHIYIYYHYMYIRFGQYVVWWPWCPATTRGSKHSYIMVVSTCLAFFHRLVDPPGAKLLW